MPFLIWLTLPFNLLIYGVNDIFDFEIDQLSLRKDSYQGARLGKAEFRRVWIGVLGLNLPFLLFFVGRISLEASAFIALYVFVFLAYSVPPFRFKARVYADSLSNAAYSLPVAIVPLYLGHAAPYLPLAALASWSVAKHAYDAIQDREVDAHLGVRTTPVALGVRGALIWCGFFWALSSLFLFSIAWPLALANGVMALGLLVPVFFDPTMQRAQKMYPFSIAYTYVMGTVAGVPLAWSVFKSLP